MFVTGEGRYLGAGRHTTSLCGLQITWPLGYPTGAEGKGQHVIALHLVKVT